MALVPCLSESANPIAVLIRVRVKLRAIAGVRDNGPRQSSSCESCQRPRWCHQCELNLGHLARWQGGFSSAIKFCFRRHGALHSIKVRKLVEDCPRHYLVPPELALPPMRVFVVRIEHPFDVSIRPHDADARQGGSAELAA